MSEKARRLDATDTPQAESATEEPRELRLISGRELKVSSRKNEDLVEIFESGGQLLIKVRLTENGPEIMIEGCKLALNAAESISLQAPKIELSADEKARLTSKGTLEIDAGEEMDIHADEDIRVIGKIIHLN